MCLPLSEGILGPTERRVTLADLDRIRVVPIAGRQRGRVARCSRLGVGHLFVRQMDHQLLEVVGAEGNGHWLDVPKGRWRGTNSGLSELLLQPEVSPGTRGGKVARDTLTNACDARVPSFYG